MTGEAQGRKSHESDGPVAATARGRDLDLIEETFNDLRDLVLRYENRLVFKWRSPDAGFAVDTHRKLVLARSALRRLRNANA